MISISELTVGLQMNPKERFLNAISSIKNEGFGSYLLRRIKYRIASRFRRFRYPLVGFLYGHRFDHDSVKLAQLECFCHELAAHSLLQKSKLQNENIEVISLLKLSEDAFQKKKTLFKPYHYWTEQVPLIQSIQA